VTGHANEPWRPWAQEEIDDAMLSHESEEDEDDGSECGRWLNGGLSNQCTKAGSEECDWHCPIGLPRRRKGS
jgi:hypothetical protein